MSSNNSEDATVTSGNDSALRDRSDDDDNNDATSLAHDNSSTCSWRALQQAIQDEEWDALPNIVKHCSVMTSKLWWHANAAGWTAVHFAASLPVPLPWWQWILQQQLKPTLNGSDCRKHDIITRRNHVGQSVLDVAVQTIMDPLPWQQAGAEMARHTQHALRQVLEHDQQERDIMLQKIRYGVQEMLQKLEAAATHNLPHAKYWLETTAATTNSNNVQDDKDDNEGTVRIVKQCVHVVCRLQVLANATTEDYSRPIMQLLAQCENLSPILARFLWHLYPKQATVETLHFWANDTTNRLVMTHPYHAPVPAWLQALLQVYPDFDNLVSTDVFAAAVATGKSWPALQFLRSHNHRSNNFDMRILLRFALVQRQQQDQTHRHTRALVRAREAAATSTTNHHLGSCVYQLWPATRQAVARQAAATDLETEELSVVYKILRHDVSLW